MKTLLIAHEEDSFNRVALAAWLASVSDLAGIISIVEPPARKKRRVRRELERVGYLRFADVLAFQLYYRLFLARRDRAWLDAEVERVTARYGALPSAVPVLRTPSPNSAEAERFVRDAAPDLAIARCKTLLSERVFTVAVGAGLDHQRTRIDLTGIERDGGACRRRIDRGLQRAPASRSAVCACDVQSRSGYVPLCQQDQERSTQCVAVGHPYLSHRIHRINDGGKVYN